MYFVVSKTETAREQSDLWPKDFQNDTLVEERKIRTSELSMDTMVNTYDLQALEKGLSHQDIFSIFDDRTTLQSEYNNVKKYFLNNIGSKKQNVDKTKNFIDDRIKLLAKKYVTDLFPTEDSARLEIINERLRRLIPGVSYEEIDNLEQIATTLHSLNDQDKELRKRLGIKE